MEATDVKRQAGKHKLCCQNNGCSKHLLINNVVALSVCLVVGGGRGGERFVCLRVCVCVHACM